MVWRRKWREGREGKRKDGGRLEKRLTVPFDSIAIIRRKLVMEVVVAFAEGDQGGEDMIPGRVAVIKGLITKPMGKRVNAECG